MFNRKTSFVLVIALAAIAAFAAAFMSPTGRMQSNDRSEAASGVAAPVSPFFGNVLSRENDFFYKSLLSIYRDRYVPAAPVGGGHFTAAQSGSGTRNADKKTGSANNSTGTPVDQTGSTSPGIIRQLTGRATVDPDIDSALQQRQIRPDVVTMVPISQDVDLRDLPYMPPSPRETEAPLRRHPLAPPGTANAVGTGTRTAKPAKPAAQNGPAVAPSMSSPLQTFEGIDSNASGCACLPPDTDGDVGSNNYIQSENSSIRISDKQGNIQAGPITYNSFFSAMGTATPCGNNNNDGDGIVFYDHMADRWVVSDFAFPAFPGTSFYQCIGVSKTSDPITGGWWLYAVQVDPANNNFLGDYPKFGVWPDGYYLSMNEFSNNTTFNGVRVYALDRSSMINGGSANAIGFSILPADLGDQYSLVPASFRTGSGALPAGQPEWFMDINSSATAGTVETQVFVRRFHADFVTPANSTFGLTAAHTPNGAITVNGFKDVFFSGPNPPNLIPNGTATTTQFLDSLGDKLMYPLIYQNRGGVESIYATHTNAPSNNGTTNTGPTKVRWYQFNMTGNTIPATPVQQQDFDNGADGLFRWMPSINVDVQGNVAIGYSASSTTVNPGIRYAGRLATDPLNNMSQGEVTMTPGTGHQTDTSGRWGDYSTMFVDPSDSCTFYHTNEYYSVTSGTSWRTKVGLFRFPGCVTTALPTPSPTVAPTPIPSPTPPVSAGPITVTATAGTLGPTDYVTLQLAFAAINAGTHKGAINVAVLGNTTETVSALLNSGTVAPAAYTSVMIQPTGVRTISGNLAAPLVDLNGAKNVTFNGLNSGGNSLTLSNTNNGAAAGTSTIRFISTTATAGGASNNTVMNCSILGSSTVALGAAGGNVLFSTTTANGTSIVGNNNNLITQNNIGPAGGNLPIKAITGLGTAGNNTVNTGDVIDNNNIFDFFGTGGVSVAGIDIRANNTGWTISNNRIFQTATRTFTTTALRYSGILVNGGASDFHTISGNTIGFGAANGTGTTTITGSSNEFRGIDAPNASTGAATSIQGNTISGINQTTSRSVATSSSAPFIGIVVGVTNGIFDIGTTSGNTIGSLDASSGVVVNETSTTAGNASVIGVYDFSFTSGQINNNKIGTITINSGGSGTTVGFRGILVDGTGAQTSTINNNTIGGTAVGSITDNIVGSYSMYGIQTGVAAVSINGNTIRNFIGNASVAASVVVSGITFSSTSTTAVSTISRNTISNLTNNSGAVSNSIYAIDLTFPANSLSTGNLVERNSIYSNTINSTDNTSQIWGIVNRGAASSLATATIQNNMVRLGVNSAGASVTGGFSIIGIRDIQGVGTSAMSYYFNSVYIGGSGVVASSNTFAFNSDVSNTRNFRDNIFVNARSNASGAGKNYAIAVAGGGPNPAGLTTNFNDLFVTGTGTFVGLYNSIDRTALSDWQTATGQDASSISADPLFVNPNGTSLPDPVGGVLGASPDTVNVPLAVVDLHLQATSPAKVAGTQIAATNADPINGIFNDIDNITRPAVPTIGAAQLNTATAAAVSVSGRVMTAGGRGLRNARVVMTDTHGVARVAITGAFGQYQFDDVQSGETYVIRVMSKRFTFGTRVLVVTDTLTDVDFIAGN